MPFWISSTVASAGLGHLEYVESCRNDNVIRLTMICFQPIETKISAWKGEGAIAHLLLSNEIPADRVACIIDWRGPTGVQNGGDLLCIDSFCPHLHIQLLVNFHVYVPITGQWEAEASILVGDHSHVILSKARRKLLPHDAKKKHKKCDALDKEWFKGRFFKMYKLLHQCHWKLLRKDLRCRCTLKPFHHYVDVHFKKDCGSFYLVYQHLSKKQIK